MSYCNNLLDPKPMCASVPPWRTFWLISSILVSVLGTAPALAKFEDYLTKRWFAIEVIVFERSNIDDKNTLEALAIPRPAPPPEVLAAAEDLLDEPVVSSEPDDSLAAADEAINASGDAREPTAQRILLETQIFEEDPTKEALRLDFLQAITAYELELESRNLVFEPDSNPRLEAELKRLARPRNHNIVWRGHWLQAVPDRNEPQPLDIAVNELESGEFELTGSLEVTVNRYLHLHAQLWYHDPAFGAELLSAEFTNIEAGANPGQRRNPTDSESPQESSRYIDATPAPTLFAQPAIEQPLTQPLFMVLEETRRMRSGILHYLDHPKLGLLVRIDKLTAPQELLTQYQLFEASQE